MMSCEKDDVILVPFPFSDQSASKRRPAVVISSDKYNTVSQDIIIMAVTSRTDGPFAGFETTIEHWKEAGLLKPSVIKPVVATLSQSMSIRKLGKLSGKDKITLETYIKAILGL